MPFFDYRKRGGQAGIKGKGFLCFSLLNGTQTFLKAQKLFVVERDKNCYFSVWGQKLYASTDIMQ